MTSTIPRKTLFSMHGKKQTNPFYFIRFEVHVMVYPKKKAFHVGRRKSLSDIEEASGFGVKNKNQKNQKETNDGY